ncbi:hypothetical protein D9M72_287270 [compost metagenome]
MVDLLRRIQADVHALGRFHRGVAGGHHAVDVDGRDVAVHYRIIARLRLGRTGRRPDVDRQRALGCQRRPVEYRLRRGAGAGRHEVRMRVGVQGGVGVQAADAVRQRQQLQSRERQEQSQAVRHGAHVMGGVGLEKENRQQYLGHAGGEHVAPAFIAHDIRGGALHQPVDQEQQAENHGQHEVPVVVAGQHQDARGQHHDPLGIAQRPLSSHSRLGDGQRRQALDHEERGEEVQREINGVVQRVDENRDAGDQEQPAGDRQGAGALAQIVDAKQQ